MVGAVLADGVRLSRSPEAGSERRPGTGGVVGLHPGDDRSARVSARPPGNRRGRLRHGPLLRRQPIKRDRHRSSGQRHHLDPTHSEHGEVVAPAIHPAANGMLLPVFDPPIEEFLGRRRIVRGVTRVARDRLRLMVPREPSISACPCRRGHDPVNGHKAPVRTAVPLHSGSAPRRRLASHLCCRQAAGDAARRTGAVESRTGGPVTWRRNDESAGVSTEAAGTVALARHEGIGFGVVHPGRSAGASRLAYLGPQQADADVDADNVAVVAAVTTSAGPATQ